MSLKIYCIIRHHFIAELMAGLEIILLFMGLKHSLTGFSLEVVNFEPLHHFLL